MPANKNAVTRYYILDKLLANRYHHYSTEDLRQLVNEELKELDQEPVSRRTIELDLHYLEYEGPFLAEIEHYQIDVPSQTNPNKTVKKSCHRYADPSFSIFKKEMTEDEKYLLSETLSMLGQFDGLPNLEGLDALKKSLDVKTEWQIVSFDKNPLKNKNHFGVLFTAISQRYVVELHYHLFSAPGEQRKVVVHPYMLKEYNRRWYIIAGADNTGKVLNFALDRIDEVIARPEIEYKPYEGDLNERFEEIIGVSFYEENPLQTIVFWVSDNSVDYIATKPMHESHTPICGDREEELRLQYPSLKGGRFFKMECRDNYELRRELTSFGEDLIVLSPEDIKQKVINRVKGLCNKYDLLG